MADITITESEMQFGPMAEERLIRLESCATYHEIQHGLPMAEFSYFQNEQNKRLITVEAKSSSPRDGNEPDFSKYIGQVKAKLANGFQLIQSLWIGRFEPSEGLPKGMKEVDFATVEHQLILVIHDHQPTWLPPIQDALRKELNSLVKIWNLGPNSVVVMNDKMARSRGLIQ